MLVDCVEVVKHIILFCHREFHHTVFLNEMQIEHETFMIIIHEILYHIVFSRCFEDFDV